MSKYTFVSTILPITVATVALCFSLASIYVKSKEKSPNKSNNPLFPIIDRLGKSKWAVITTSFISFLTVLILMLSELPLQLNLKDNYKQKIHGLVLDATTNKALNGVVIQIEGFTTVTDSTGTWSLTIQKNDTSRNAIYYYRKGYLTQVTSITPGEAGDIITMQLQKSP